MTTPGTGTVIHGTMREQDLIPAFLEELRERSPAEYAQIIATPFSLGPSDAWLDDSHEWWSSDAASYFLEDLFEALDHAAPEGYFFGAHPGDGSDFGYWVVEDD